MFLVHEIRGEIFHTDLIFTLGSLNDKQNTLFKCGFLGQYCTRYSEDTLKSVVNANGPRSKLQKWQKWLREYGTDGLLSGLYYFCANGIMGHASVPHPQLLPQT